MKPNAMTEQQKTKSQRTKNIAVIGAGYWGKNLVRTFHELRALNTICDSKKDTLKKLTETYPDLKTAQDYADILRDPKIEGVVIATPAVTHYRFVKDAILSGKHVFVEKPLALSVKDGEELIKLARDKQKILMVGHILQYHNALIKLKELVDAGDLGKIQYIYSNRLNIGKIRSEENILWSFAPHDISVILMLLKEFPETVFTTGGTYLQQNVVDVTMTNFHFSNGVKAHIFVSWLHPYKEQKLVVVGDKKMAVFDDVSQEKLFLYPHKVEWIDRIPVASKAKAEIVSFPVEEPLKNECEHFLECIEKGSQPRTDGIEGLNVLRILNMCQESLNSGKAVYTKTEGAGNTTSYFVHESSFVDEGVKIGKDTQIWHYSHVLKGSVIGERCKIGQNVVIGPEVSVGDGCRIQNNVSVYKGVTLEENVFCGPSMVFTNVMNPRSAINRMKEYKKTLVKKGTTIGANATILCGVTLGRYSFVGAGAVVTKDVPDYALVYGSPARVHGWMCECGVKLEFKKSGRATCKECQSEFSLKKNKVTKV